MRIVLAMWVLASIAACRKDSGPSVDELRPKLEGLRTRIAKYATTLPDVQPIPVPGKLDTPGKLAARVYVVDLASDKPLAVFDTSATTPESIKVEAVVNAKAGAEAQTEAAMTAARLKLSDELRASLRGNIQSALAPLGKANVYENPNAVD